jgi:hypothetical protein
MMETIFNLKPAESGLIEGVIYDVIPNDLICVSFEFKQIRFPKSKKVRIRKKWMKNPLNYKYNELRKVVVVRDKIFMPTKEYYEYKESMIKKFKDN